MKLTVIIVSVSAMMVAVLGMAVIYVIRRRKSKDYHSLEFKEPDLTNFESKLTKGNGF